jgi:hypothetical protein
MTLEVVSDSEGGLIKPTSNPDLRRNNISSWAFSVGASVALFR